MRHAVDRSGCRVRVCTCHDDTAWTLGSYAHGCSCGCRWAVPLPDPEERFPGERNALRSTLGTLRRRRGVEAWPALDALVQDAAYRGDLDRLRVAAAAATLWEAEQDALLARREQEARVQ